MIKTRRGSAAARFVYFCLPQCTRNFLKKKVRTDQCVEVLWENTPVDPQEANGRAATSSCIKRPVLCS